MEIKYECSKCGKAIEDLSSGSVVVINGTEWRDFKEVGEKEWEEETLGLFGPSKLFECFPYVTCHDCYRPGEDEYSIDLPRIATDEDLLRWTAHLLQNKWITDIDWGGFIFGCLKDRIMKRLREREPYDY
jgi:hypothetical protein